MSFAEHQAQHRRICILRLLHDDPDYELNESLLQDLLGVYGLRVPRDQVLGDVSWLDEQGLVEVRYAAGVAVAKLTRRGADVAQGHATHPGVKRPGP